MRNCCLGERFQRQLQEGEGEEEVQQVEEAKEDTARVEPIRENVKVEYGRG